MAEIETPSGHADDLRQRAEAAPGEAERLARAALDALSAHIAILDETGAIIATNRAWRNFAQANPPLLANVGEGANYLAVCDTARGAGAATAAAFAAAVRAVMRGELKEFSLQYPCHSPGEQRWFNVRATRFSAVGAVRVVVAHENITGRKLAEEKLRESEERFRRLSEATFEGILIHEGSVALNANDQFCEMFGYQPDELLGEAGDPANSGT